SPAPAGSCERAMTTSDSPPTWQDAVSGPLLRRLIARARSGTAVTRRAQERMQLRERHLPLAAALERRHRPVEADETGPTRAGAAGGGRRAGVPAPGPPVAPPPAAAPSVEARGFSARDTAAPPRPGRGDSLPTPAAPPDRPPPPAPVPPRRRVVQAALPSPA